MDRVLVNQGARGRLASDSLKDFSNLALASLSLTNTTGLGSGIRRPGQVLGSRRGKSHYTQRRSGFTGHATASPSARAREREVVLTTFLRYRGPSPVGSSRSSERPRPRRRLWCYS